MSEEKILSDLLGTFETVEIRNIHTAVVDEYQLILGCYLRSAYEDDRNRIRIALYGKTLNELLLKASKITIGDKL